MRLLAITAFLALSGCSAAHEDVELRQLAGGLSRAWPRAQWDLYMTVSAEDQAGTTVLHCVLENTSAEPIKVNASTLPWVTPSLFGIHAVSADGTVIYRQGLIQALTNEPEIVTIGVGENLQGKVHLTELPIGVEAPLPRSEDLLLLWSYSLDDGSYSGEVSSSRPPRFYFVSGTTLLTKM